MSSVSENDVTDRNKGICKGQYRSRSQRCVASGLVDANCDHTDHHSRKDGYEGRNGHERHLLESSRQVENEEKDQSDYCPDDGASRTIGYGVEADRPGQDVAGHGEN